ncbi:response regulator transcription factor [Paenibacillus cymbidii]|uniref:response regulator transcription factor n=1 Tax=Paenibacillus cymbidii TaxID=1639034 RepID=UPI0014368483|nr:response regulator [Paenibacillus cymbidii]
MTGTIVIAEDQPNFRTGLCSIIERHMPGWTVAGEADNGEDAWAHIQTFNPEIVLLDIHMPGMSGIEVAERIHVNKLDTIIIIITGYQDFHYAQAALRFGAFDFLLKPCSEEEIMTALRKALDKICEKPVAQPSPVSRERLPMDGYGQVVDKIIRYIDEHYMDDCSVSAIAAHVFLNPSYVSTLFKKKCGESLTSYMTKVRMEKAMFLLTHTDMKIAEISRATGFDEPTYFTNVFKKFAAMAPSEYRFHQTSKNIIDDAKKI